MFFTSLLQSNLKVKKFARNIIYYPRTESTSDDIWELYRENKDSTLLVISDYQTKGRGRFNKKWFSSPGVNLTFSFLLKDIYPDNKKNKREKRTSIATAGNNQYFFLANRNFINSEIKLIINSIDSNI